MESLLRNADRARTGQCATLLFTCVSLLPKPGRYQKNTYHNSMVRLHVLLKNPGPVEFMVHVRSAGAPAAGSAIEGGVPL